MYHDDTNSPTHHAHAGEMLGQLERDKPKPYSRLENGSPSEYRAVLTESDVAADVRQGTRRDAVLFSVGANSSHGVRRSNADKRAAVLLLLGDAEWALWTDVEVARRCGVSSMFVGNLRRDIIKPFNDAPRKATRNGVTYAMNTAAIGRGNGGGAAP